MPKDKPQPDVEAATHIIAKIVDDRSDETSISPSWVATEAMTKLGVKSLLKGKGGQPIVYQLAHLQCRQIARQLLRKFYEPDEDAAKAQHELFPNLQGRYPAAPKPGREEPEYIRLESLTVADWRFNVDRLRADAQSRIKHSDALEVWGNEHFGGAATAAPKSARPKRRRPADDRRDAA